MDAPNPDPDPALPLRETRRGPLSLPFLATLLAVCAALLGSALVHLEWRRAGVVSVGADLDPYVRLVRVSQLASSGAWLDSSIPDSHLGQPEEVAWSRPLDVLVLSLFLPLRALLPERDALLLAGSLVSPLLWAACVPLLIAALRPLGLGPFGILCSILAFVCHPTLTPHFDYGRCDHHALLQVCLLAFLASMLRAVDPRGAPRWSFAAGGVAGFGIWVHPEAILVPAVACGFLALRWCSKDALAAGVLRDLALGALLLLALATLCEHGPAAFLEVEHDRVSVVHVTLFAAVAALGVALRRLEPQLRGFGSRLLAAGGLAATTLGLLELAYPGFHQGPLRAMDPALREVWFSGLAQSQPLWRIHVDLGLEYLVLTLFMGALALGSLWWHRARVGAAGRRGIELLLFAAVVTTALAFGFRRLTSVLAYLYIPSMGLLAESLWRRFGRRKSGSGPGRRGVRLAAIEAILVAVALGPQVVRSAVQARVEHIRPAAEGTAQAACRDELLRWIQVDHVAELSGRHRALVLTRPSEAPALLFWTDHRIVAWNHHRSTQGLLLLDRFFRAADEAALRRAAVETGAELLLYCPGADRDEPYWRRDAPEPLPPWIATLAGDRSGDGPVLLSLEPADRPSLASRSRE